MTQNYTQQHKQPVRFAFFGTDTFSVLVLEELKRHNLAPNLLVTAPDSPQGRKLEITPPDAKIWAKTNSIPTLQPDTLSQRFHEELENAGPWDVFLIASYGMIIPKAVLDIPRCGSLNIHPSLLPKLRGASPVQSAILSENHTGVTLMQMDEKMDHGPIVAQKEVPVQEWPPKAALLEAILAKEGARLFADTIESWCADAIKPTEQDHSAATFTKKIAKHDAELDFQDPPERNLRKIRAFHEWPRAYFFATKNDAPLRVIVTDAHLDENGALVLDRVIPEGKSEMPFRDFQRGSHAALPPGLTESES